MFIQNNESKITAESLKTYSKNKLEKIEQNSYKYKSFFARLDIDELTNTVETGTSETIIDLRRFINSVYRIGNLKDFFLTDLSNLLLFREKLNFIRTVSVIKGKKHRFIKERYRRLHFKTIILSLVIFGPILMRYILVLRQYAKEWYFFLHVIVLSDIKHLLNERPKRNILYPLIIQ